MREGTIDGVETSDALIAQQALERGAQAELLERRTRAAEEAQAHAEWKRADLERTFSQAPVALAMLDGPTHVFTLANAAYAVVVSDRPLLGLSVREALPELEGQDIYELLDTVYASGERAVMSEVRLHRVHPRVPHRDRYSRDKQHSIFDPFVQVHRNLTRSTEGTGLGLAISRDLARGMEGDLRVRSAEGHGSTFTLTLQGGQ